MEKKLLSFLAVFIFSLFLLGCSQETNLDNEEEIDVVVSILPQKYFVEAVGKDLVNVNAIIPPGGSPATYNPNPEDLILIERADIYFKIGHIPFEKSNSNRFVELNNEMIVVDTSANANLRYFSDEEEHSHEEEHYEENHSHEEEHHEQEHTNEEEHHEEEHHEENHSHEQEHHENEIDPHIWLSPLEVKKQVDIIAEELSKIDPDNEDLYFENAQEFNEELDNLNLQIKEQLSLLDTNKLMVFHPAWGYFAREYDLEQIAIEESGKEPTSQELQALIERADSENIKVIFVQSQFNENIARSVADEIGAVVVSLDPLSEDYINNLKNISIKISQNLS